MPATIKELAGLARVSAATVSLVLSGKDRGRVGATRRRKILDLAARHGYRLNPAARGLAEGRTYRIAFCVQGALATREFSEFALNERLGLFSKTMQAAGYASEIVEVSPDQDPSDACDELAARAVDGYVFLVWPSETVAPLMAAMARRGIPSAASGSTLADSSLVWTDIDRRDAFRRATEYLIAEGHEGIVLLDVGPHIHSHVKREAFEAVILDRLGPKGGRIEDVPRPTFTSVLEATERLLKERRAPTAFLLTGNYYYEAVLCGLRHRGLRPGQDRRVIGFGSSAIARMGEPPLTHYGLRIEEQVAFAAEALLSQIRNPDGGAPHSRFFEAEFVPGGT